MTRVRTNAPGTPTLAEETRSQPSEAPARTGPDAFVAARPKGPVLLEARPGLSQASPHEPSWVPHIPPGVTSDPARQFQAMLGPLKDAVAGAGPIKSLDVTALLSSLPAPRAKLLRGVLAEPDESPRRLALQAFLDDPKLAALDVVKQRKALAAFALPRIAPPGRRPLAK